MIHLPTARPTVDAPKGVQPKFMALLVAALLSTASSHALAQANNVVLDNLSVTQKDKGTMTFKRIEVLNTNLSKDELFKLFSGGASKEESAALVKKMKADKLSIPEAVFVDKESTFTLRDFQATGINEGKIATAVLKSADGKGKSKGGSDVNFKSGAIEFQGLGMAGALSAIASGDAFEGSMQASKFSWAGFEATAPDEDVKPGAPGGNLYKISLGAVVADGSYDGEIPLKSKGELKSLVIEPPKTSSMGQAISSFGYDKLTMGMVFSGEYDKAKKTYVLDNFIVNGVNAGALGLKVSLGSIEPTVFTGKKEAKLAGMMGGTIFSLSIRFDNAGLFEKSVDFMAKQQKKQPADLKKEWSGMVTGLLPMLMGGDPGSLKLAGAVAKFIETPKNLTISAKAKDAPVKLIELSQIKDPSAMLKLIDLDAVAGQ